MPTGDLPIVIEWKLNGELVSEALGISTMTVGRRSSVLTIESVDHQHAGNFTCNASNRAGVQSYSTELNVYG